MAWRSVIAVLLLAVLQQQSLRTAALSTKAMDAGGLPSDVKYIKCEVCSQVAKSATAAVNDMEVEKKLDALQVLDTIESLCEPKQKTGRWMRKIDLVERLRKLRLIEQEGQQECKRECRTMALACRDVLDGVETELAERLYSLRKDGKEVAVKDVEDWLCAKRSGASDVCRKTPAFLPKDRAHGPPFEAKSEKDAKMENILEDIRSSNPGNDMGLDMMNAGQMGGMAGMDGDDDEDDDDDDDDDDEDQENDEDDMGKEDAGDAMANESESNGHASDKAVDGIDAGSLDDTSLGFVDGGTLDDIEAGKAKVEDTSGKAGSVDAGSDEL